MGTETKYRVGVVNPAHRGLDMPAVFLGEYSAPNDRETFVKYGSAKLFGAKQMSSWVQVLATMYPYVLVERVEVDHA